MQLVRHRGRESRAPQSCCSSIAHERKQALHGAAAARCEVRQPAVTAWGLLVKHAQGLVSLPAWAAQEVLAQLAGRSLPEPVDAAARGVGRRITAGWASGRGAVFGLAEVAVGQTRRLAARGCTTRRSTALE